MRLLGETFRVLVTVRLEIEVGFWMHHITRSITVTSVIKYKKGYICYKKGTICSSRILHGSQMRPATRLCASARVYVRVYVGLLIWKTTIQICPTIPLAIECELGVSVSLMAQPAFGL